MNKWRHNFAIAAVVIIGAPFFAHGQQGTLNCASGLAASANYSLIGSTGETAGGQSSAGPYTNTSGGPASQPTTALSITLNASPLLVGVGSTSQLGGSAVMDDDSVTLVTGSNIIWNIVSGPVASINANGVLTGGSEMIDSAAVVSGGWMGVANTTTVYILNGTYGTYGGGGIPDTWQVEYFGVNNPLAAPGTDADATGQTNQFKYVMGLNPLVVTSRFVMNLAPVQNEPGQMAIVFSPVYDGITYTVQYTSNLVSPNWQSLTGGSQTISGSTMTVTDPNATGPKKFYRVLGSQ